MVKALLLSSEPVDYTIAMANGLAPHLRIGAILPRQKYEPLRRWIDPRVELNLVDWPRTRSLSNPAFLWRLNRMIQDQAPDVLHLLSNTSLWFNAALPVWRRRPLVTTVHDVALHPGDRDTARLPGWTSRLMARQSPHLIVHGEGLRRAAARSFGKAQDHVHVVPHPAIRRYADLARIAGLHRSRPEGEFVVLLFGRIFAYKGLGTLISAEKMLSGSLPGLRLVIAGRGDDPAGLRPLMGRPECYDIRRGFIEDIEVAQLFTDADVVVLPYEEASQSGVLHLAAAFGKPVIVTDTGELRVTVEPNGLGLVVPPRAPDRLAAAIAALARDPELRARLGENARRWSEGPNAATTIGGTTADLYARIARHPPP